MEGAYKMGNLLNSIKSLILCVLFFPQAKQNQILQDKDDMICIYTMGYYRIIKNGYILPFAATWMLLEGIMLSEISQEKTNTLCYLL